MTATEPSSAAVTYQPTPVDRALAALVKLLEHNDAEVRLKAAEAIIEARRDGVR